MQSAGAAEHSVGLRVFVWVSQSTVFTLMLETYFRIRRENIKRRVLTDRQTDRHNVVSRNSLDLDVPAVGILSSL